jgi:FKBP-type peptidyl-prolyl cis-trans isomerase
MRKNYLYLSLLLFLVACESSGVKTTEKTAVIKQGTVDNRSQAERLLDPAKTIVDKKEFPSGLKIQWFKKGTGPAIQPGEVVEINFKLQLPSGDVVDGNHLLKREMIPFLVGYNMQTSGWDMAFNELHVGDFVELFLPPNLARGEKGIPNLIPPNSPNIVLLRVGKKVKPTKTVNGVKVWLLEENTEMKAHTIDENAQVAIHYFVGTKTNPRYDNSYQRNVPFQFGMKDVSLIPGLKKGLLGTKLFDKLWVLVPPSQAYGKKGMVDLVKPNEALFYDLIIMDVNGMAEKVLAN